MSSEWVTVIGTQWPWLILVAAFILGVPYAIKSLRALKDFLWNPFIAYLKRASEAEQQRMEIDAAKVDARIEGLEGQVAFLLEQVGELRYRDRMYWAWVVIDQQWHRDLELLAVEKGWDLPPHITFDEFHDDWAAKHPMPKSFQI